MIMGDGDCGGGGDDDDDDDGDNDGDSHTAVKRTTMQAGFLPGGCGVERVRVKVEVISERDLLPREPPTAHAAARKSFVATAAGSARHARI